MPKIAAGEDFGRAVPGVVGMADVAQVNVQPGRGLAEIGRRDEQRALHVEQQQAAEEKALQDERRRLREADDRADAGFKTKIAEDRLRDTLETIGTDVLEGRLHKSAAAKTWAEKSAEIVQSAAAEIPESQRGRATQGLNAVLQMHTSKVGNIVSARDRLDTRANLYGLLEAFQRDAGQDYKLAKTRAMAALDSLGPFAGMGPDEIQKAKQAWLEGAAYTRAFSAVNAAKNDNRALAAAEKAIASNADLDPQRQAQLLAQVDGYKASNEARALRQAQAAEIAASRRDREAQQAWSVLSGWAMAGKVADPNANAGLIAKLDGTPFAGAYRELAAEIPKRTAVAMLPLEVQQQQLDGLRAKSTKGTSPELETEIKRRQEVLDSARREYKEDPLRAGSQFGVIDALQPLDLSNIDGLVKSISTRIEQAQTVSTRTRTNVSPLLSEEAGRLGDMLGKMPPPQQARAIAQLSQVLPAGMRQALADQIDAKDKGLALAFASTGSKVSKTTEGRFIAELILKGRQGKIDGTSTKGEKVPDEAVTKWNARAAEALNGAFLNQKFSDQVKDAAVLIMHGIASENGGRLTKDDMARAVRIAVGGNVVEHNGARIPVPAGIGREGVERRMTQVTEQEIRAQAPDGKVRAGGVVISVADLVEKLPGTPLAAAKNGVYTPMVEGRPVVNMDGRPILIEVQ